MSAMFVTVNHIPARGDAGPALEARFQARQRMVDQLPGFRSFELLRPRDARAGEYLVMTAWATRADFEAWRSSPQQRPVRPAQHGHLSQPDEQSWPTFHETVSERHASTWPPPDGSAMSIELLEQAPEAPALVEGCVSVEVLRGLEGSWGSPEEAAAPEYLVVRRWTGTPPAGAQTYDIVQPSYAGQPAAAQ